MTRHRRHFREPFTAGVIPGIVLDIESINIHAAENTTLPVKQITAGMVKHAKKLLYQQI
jgi:hypothetical protein